MHTAVRPLPSLRPASEEAVDEVRVRLLAPDMPCAAQLQPFLERIDAHRQYTSFGPLARELEAGLASVLSQLSGADVFATTTSSGTTALEMGLATFRLKSKARVLLPSLTFPGTATAVLRAGAVPVLGDVDRRSWLLTPEIARRILERTQIDAIIPVATFGAPQPVAAWDEFMAETGCPVLIDAAGAFGEQKVGHRSTVAFSLHATKALGVGEGGLVASQSPQFVEKVRRWSNFGIEAGRCEAPGTNGQMSEYHAAVGLAQLARWPELQARRQKVWGIYRRLLSRRVGYRAVRQRRPRPVAPTLMVLRLPVEAEGVARCLRGQGVETRRWYCPPLHRHPGFAAVERVPVAGQADLLVTDHLGDHLLGLPFHSGLGESEVDVVCNALAEALNDRR